MIRVSRKPRTSALALAAALLACGLSTAHATTESDIPPECGSRAAFEQALRQRLGDTVETSRVSVVITPAGARARLRVQIGSEMRELHDPSCTELFRAALVIAVAMLGREPAIPPPAPAPKAPEPALSRYPRLSAGVGAGINVGTLPHPALALELESKLLWRSLGASASLRYLTPSEQTTPIGRSVRLHALGLAASGVFRPSRSWEARLGFAAQRLSGKGRGSTADGADSAWAAGPTLGLAFIPLQTSGLWAGIGAEGQLNALRAHFEILNYYQPDRSEPYRIYQVPWLAGSAFVRLGAVW